MLTLFNEPNGINNFTYDAVGNRKTEVGTDQNGTTVNRTAIFDDLNQLTRLSSGSLMEDFEYDANGNLTTHKQNNAEVVRYEYDGRNQLTKYEGIGSGINVAFDYDFEKKRISKTSANLRTDYVYAGNQIVSEYQGSINSANYTIGGGEIVKSEFASGENNFHFTDALGSVTSLANAANGSLTTRNEYNAFGEVSTTGNTANSIGYTGQRLDNETGLMALGNGERYYSPAYARFIQQDRIAGKTDTPQSMNRFSYAHNNPNKYTDPSGNFAFLIPIGIGIVVFAGAFYVGVSAVEERDEVQKRNDEQIKQGVDPSTLPNADLTAVANNIPFFSSAFRAVTGQDPISGEDLSAGWRIANGVFAVLDALPFTKGGSKLLGKLGKPIERFGSYLTRNKRLVEDITETIPKPTRLFDDKLDDGAKAADRVGKQLGKLDFDDIADQQKAAEDLLRTQGAEQLDKLKKSGQPLGMADDSVDIALGLRVNRQGENILESFASEVKAVPTSRWHTEGLADLNRPFVQRFYQAVYRSVSKGGKIKFNLDYLSLNRALKTKRFSDPFDVGVTNWELQQVLHNKSLYKNTHFYIGSQRLSKQDVLDFGLEYRGQ